MTISIHSMARGTFLAMLGSLSSFLEKGAEHAAANRQKVGTLLEGRLAPDMYTLTQQVQLACHHALDAFARLSGGEARTPEPLDETMSAVRARIAETIKLVEETPQRSFAKSEKVTIVIPISDAMRFEMTAEEFLRDWALPHFYFHVVTAYDILRHNGVDLGKKDYAGGVGRYIKGAPPR
jgi:hypothetical protein